MRTALLEIDFQPWIVQLAHDPGAVSRAVHVRQALRRCAAVVVCSRYLSMDAADPLRSDPDGPGACFAPGLAPEPGDVVVTKHGRDVFAEPDLEATLRQHGVGHLVITGLLTDHGVRVAAESATHLGLAVSVASDACAGSSALAHTDALSNLSAAGVTVRSFTCLPHS